MDKNPDSYQWLMLFGFQALALILLSQLNQTLTTLSLFLFINGLFIAFPALFLPLGQGLTAVVLFAIFYDSGESWAFGTSLIPSMALFTILYSIRSRIRYDRKGVIRPVIMLANLILFIYYSILAGLRFEFTAPFFFLNLVQVLFSELVLFVVAGWLVSYQKELLLMFNVDVDATLRAAK